MGIREAVDELIAAFNRGSLDVPANFFTARTTFTLNQRPYESLLGGSPDDPLIRLLARGAAGYRTAAKALQYALTSPTIIIESFTDAGASGSHVASLRVEGRWRDTGEPFSGLATLRLGGAGSELASVDVLCAEEYLARIAASRLA